MSATLVDWSQPIELDDGTPATLVRVPGQTMHRRVRIAHTPYRGQDLGPNDGREWWYNEDGTWNGGDRKENFYIRNANNEEDYNDDFK